MAHLAAQPAGQLALLVGGVGGCVWVVAVMAALLGVLVRAAVAPAVVVVATWVFAVFMAMAVASAGVGASLGVFVRVAVAVWALAVFLAAVAAFLSLLVRAAVAHAVAAAQATGRPSAAAPLMNDNRYLGQSISPVWWPAPRPAQWLLPCFYRFLKLYSVLNIY